MARWWSAMKARPCFRIEVEDRFPAAVTKLMRDRGETAWPRLGQMLGVN